jgi:hypothetical protein
MNQPAVLNATETDPARLHWMGGAPPGHSVFKRHRGRRVTGLRRSEVLGLGDLDVARRRPGCGLVLQSGARCL